MIEEFQSKYRFLKQLKCLGEARHSFTRMLPIIARAKLRRIPKSTLILRQEDPMKNIYFIKQGNVMILRQLRFIKPEFAEKIPSLDNDAMYQDPDDFGIHRDN